MNLEDCDIEFELGEAEDKRDILLRERACLVKEITALEQRIKKTNYGIKQLNQYIDELQNLKCSEDEKKSHKEKSTS